MNIKNFAFFGVMASIFAAANAYATNPVTQVATVNYVKQNAAAADYDNQTSGLTATTIQSAIDEVAGGAAEGATALQPGDNVSELANDAGYITSADVPAQVNADWNATGGTAQILNKPTLATVATSGSYNDLTNKPTIPTNADFVENTIDSTHTTIAPSGQAVAGAISGINNTIGTVPNGSTVMNEIQNAAASGNVQSDWNATTGAAQILNKPTLATVATSGSYNDLTNKPTLAAVATSGDYADLTNTPAIPDISGKQDTLNNTNVVVSQQNGSGNAVTAVTAANGVVTIEKGATFLTAADIAGKQDTITNVADTATNQPVVEVDQTNGQISVGRGRITYKDGMTYELANFNGGAYAAGTSCTGSNPCTLTFDGTNYTWTNMNLGNVQ